MTGRRRGASRGSAPPPGPISPTEGTARRDEPPDPSVTAREICLRLLSVRPRTRAELDKALHRRGVADDVIAEVLDRYADVGMIDDSAFARAWVTSRHHGRGLARRALAGELRRKGVDSEITEIALAEVDGESEESTARELVARRLRVERATRRIPTARDGDDPQNCDDPRTESTQVGGDKERVALVRRLVGMLARKGYSPGLAYRVVKDALVDDAEAAEIVDLLNSDDHSGG